MNSYYKVGLLLFIICLPVFASATVIPSCTAGNVEDNVEDGVDIDNECGILNASIGTINGNIEITNGGTLTINGDITSVTGSIVVCSTCTLTITGNITNMNGSITNDGTINLSGSITAEGKLELKGSGIFNIDGGSFESTGDGVVIESGSTLNMTNGSSITASSGIENEGAINSDNSGNQIFGEVTGGGTVDPNLNCDGSGCDDSILPVDLVYFISDCHNSNLVFSWLTASELNNDYFTLETSSDGNLWMEVVMINGNGTTAEPNTYSYELLNSYSNSYYRLSQTDFDGLIHLHNILFDGCSESTQAISVYPNPTFGNVKIVGLSPRSTDIRILDSSGKELRTVIGIDDEIKLPNKIGVYFILVKNPSSEIPSTIRVIKK